MALIASGTMGGATLYAAPALNADAISNTDKALADIEAASGGRLGVFAMDTASGRSIGLNADSRFGMCSTFKLLLAAAALREADAGRIDLNAALPYTKTDVVAYSPITKVNLGKGGMTIRDLAYATQTTSDNTAANLLLRQFGGPQGFTTMLRAMGDATTRVDRIEPAMNLVPAGEVRDTTTPRAMAETTARLLTSNVLTPASRKMLLDWMIETKTGMKRIRANLPKDWRAGDKTGTGSHVSMPNKYNDVAILMPPNRAPIFVAVYFEAAGYFADTRPQDEAVLAKVGELVVAWANSNEGIKRLKP